MAAASWYCSEYGIPPGVDIGDLLSSVQQGLAGLGYSNLATFSGVGSPQLFFDVSGWRGDFLIIASYWYLQSSQLGGNSGGTFGQTVYCFNGTADSSSVTDAENGNVISMINNIKFG